jgi:hypothetical protein
MQEVDNQNTQVVDEELIDDELLAEIKENGLRKPDEDAKMASENIPEEVEAGVSEDAQYLGVSVSDYSV